MTLPAHTLSARAPLIVDGQPRFGYFDDSLRDINRAGFRLHTPFGKKASRLADWVGFKEFQYFGVTNGRFVCGCALAHLRYVGVAFVYVYDLLSGEMFSRSLRSPFGIGLAMADNPVEGESRFHFLDADIRMRYEGSPRRKSMDIRIGKDFRLHAVMPEAGFEPMSLSTRIGYTGWVYTNKTACLSVQGTLRWNGQEFDLAGLRTLGHHDFSTGFMRRETFWNWACFSGMSGEHRLGINLSCGVNETSYTENCIWVDGRLVKVNLCRFEFDEQDILKDWRVWSDDGVVELRFKGRGLHREFMNAGIMASKFRQLFGHFEGELRVDGKVIPVNGIPGFVEDQYIKW